MRERLAAVRLLALDVDGVLTDGRIWILADGGEGKAFHIHDGHGLKRLMQAGVRVALISGRDSAATAHRARELGIDAVHLGVSDKAECLRRVAAEAGVELGECAYMGDDEPDLPALAAAGIALAPANAVAAVRAVADWCAQSAGGHGAVREVCELLLAAHEAW